MRLDSVIFVAPQSSSICHAPSPRQAGLFNLRQLNRGSSARFFPLWGKLLLHQRSVRQASSFFLDGTFSSDVTPQTLLLADELEGLLNELRRRSLRQWTSQPVRTKQETYKRTHPTFSFLQYPTTSTNSHPNNSYSNHCPS